MQTHRLLVRRQRHVLVLIENLPKWKQRRPFATTSLRSYGDRHPESVKIVGQYDQLKGLLANKFEKKCKIDPKGVFAINKLDLSKITTYGFDFDYTLAEYSDHMQEFIYHKAAEILCKKHQFPSNIKEKEYIPDFCIRGIHYDIQRSWFMKIDERHIVQRDTVFRGLEKVSQEEIEEKLVKSRHVPKSIMDESCFSGSQHLVQLPDIFSMPEMMLLANVVQYFTENEIDYDPHMLFKSVQDSVTDVHVKSHLYNEVAGNVARYLEKDCLRDLIQHLRRNGKSLFVLTNSGFPCVDTGLRHMVGSDWQDFFDVVMVEAKKPEFFERQNKSFRRLDFNKSKSSRNHVGDKSYNLSWDRVKEFKNGEVYCDGCSQELMKITGWRSNQLIYFGDQIFNDLQNPSYTSGWYTAAIIPEIEHEINVMNSDRFVTSVVWVQTLERLIEKMQQYKDEESRRLVFEWMAERNEVKCELKEIFNKNFGSIFRSNLQDSYFSARLRRVADMYTSSVRNLCRHETDHVFFPLRGTLPHELLVSLAFQHDGLDTAILSALKNP